MTCEESDWFRIQAFELSLISSKPIVLPPVYLWEERSICTLPCANICICLNRSAYPRNCCEDSDSGLWIKPHQFKTNCLTTCAFVRRGRRAYSTICDKIDCFASTLLFFFVEPIHVWSTPGIQFFFNFERMLYWYEIKAN